MYKNWHEINTIAQVSPLMAMALATLEITHPDPAVAKIIAAFPKCFNADKETGPVPLSIIILETKRIMRETTIRYDETECFPCSHDVVQGHGIPVIELVYNLALFGFDKGLMELPKTIPIASQIGDVIEWEGASFVVVENNRHLATICLVPAECIKIDC